MIKSSEFDVLRRESIKQKWSLKGVKIMCSYGNKASTTAQVVMQFILKINEAVITILKKETIKNILIKINWKYNTLSNYCCRYSQININRSLGPISSWVWEELQELCVSCPRTQHNYQPLPAKRLNPNLSMIGGVQRTIH